jgi:hypothetical protein
VNGRYIRDLTRTHPARTRTGRAVHAVAHDPRRNDTVALCGVNATVVEWSTDFDPFDDGGCRRCAAMAFRAYPTTIIR